MGRKYYCEYCDKSFADNPVNRRNHMRGVKHKQNRHMHYESMRVTESAAAILAEESTKKPCIKFQTQGFCDFGANCWYSHLSEERRNYLQDQVRQSQKATKKSADGEQKKAPRLEDWLSKRAKMNDSDDTTAVPQQQPTIKEYRLPPIFNSMPNLPVSLLPPPPDAFDNLPHEEWG